MGPRLCAARAHRDRRTRRRLRSAVFLRHAGATFPSPPRIVQAARARATGGGTAPLSPPRTARARRAARSAGIACRGRSPPPPRRRMSHRSARFRAAAAATRRTDGNRRRSSSPHSKRRRPPRARGGRPPASARRRRQNSTRFHGSSRGDRFRLPLARDACSRLVVCGRRPANLTHGFAACHPNSGRGRIGARGARNGRGGARTGRPGCQGTTATGVASAAAGCASRSLGADAGAQGL